MEQTENDIVRLEELSEGSPDSWIGAARQLLLEYGRFVIAQPGAARFCFRSLEKEAARLPLSYQEQGGGCLLAFLSNAPVGFVAWRALPPSAQVVAKAWEMKRLWVRPEARGLQLGRRLTQFVVDRAVASRQNAVYLDTAPTAMQNAYRLYREMGFEPCAAYNDNPVEGIEYFVKFMQETVIS
jgi:ribosomal protein S18 acetylase RimI-like enzyme